MCAGTDGGKYLKDAWTYNWDEGKWTELPWMQSAIMAANSKPCEVFTDRAGMRHVIMAGNGVKTID